jgi:hypothetical protein
VFLINRLPSKVLDNKTPDFLLHKTEALYKDLRVFGCACYPLLRPYTEHKVAFQSKKCLFLGYSNCQKGHQCLDLKTKWVYISRHVIFDEQSFPAQELANQTTSRSTTPAAGTPLIIPSSVVSSPLLSNISTAVASQDNPSLPSTESSNLEATDSAHSSSDTTSNYSSPPSPILNSQNPIDVDIDTSSISPSPDPENTYPTDVDIDTSSISPSPDPNSLRCSD